MKMGNRKQWGTKHVFNNAKQTIIKYLGYSDSQLNYVNVYDLYELLSIF